MVQRWPAVPMAAKVMPRRARSRSAVGARWRRCCHPVPECAGKRAAPRVRHGAAHHGGAGGRQHGHAGVVHQHLANVAPANDRSSRPRGGAKAGQCALAMASAWPGRSAGLSDGFHTTGSPHTTRQRGVPRPHGHGEVEGRDHAAHAQRVPGFHHAVTRALGGKWSGRTAGATGPRQSRRCRSSPAPRPGLRRESCPPPMVTRRPRSALAARSSSPSRRIVRPGRGAGTVRRGEGCVCAANGVAGAGVCWGTWATTSPVRGERTAKVAPWWQTRARPGAAAGHGLQKRRWKQQRCQTWQSTGEMFNENWGRRANSPGAPAQAFLQQRWCHYPPAPGSA